MGFLDALLVILIIILFVRVQNQKSDLDGFQREAFEQIGDLTNQLKKAVLELADLRIALKKALDNGVSPAGQAEPDTTIPGCEQGEQTGIRVGEDTESTSASRMETPSMIETPLKIPPATKVPPPDRIPPASPIPPSMSKTIKTPVGRKTTRPAAGQQLPPEHKEPPSPPVSPVPKPPPNPHPAGQFLNGLVEFFIGPFANLWGYVMKVYRYYKERDKLPVFFLTVMGIITLSVGFGYILQYSFANFLNETTKVLLGFATAICITIVGIRLIGTHEDYRDYGSGLIGLGIILNYICIYFISTYYGIASSAIGFVLIFANTLIAIGLALRFETRVVAVITLLGGALAPFYLDAEGTSPFFYMGYLWLLCAGSVYLSRRIDWKALATLSFFVGWALIEFSIGVLPGTQGWPAISAMVHLFTYLYLYQSMIDGRGFREILGKDDILLLAGSLALFLYSHFDLLGSTHKAGIVYLLNAIPFLYPGLTSRYPATPKMRVIILTISMTFVGFAVPALFSKHLMGLFWGQEALFMILLGFLFNLPVIRKEGYVLLLVAAGQIFYILPDIRRLWSETLWTGGYLNLWVLPALCALLKGLIDRYNAHADSYERRVGRFAAEALSCSIAGIYLITAFYYLPASLSYLTIPLAFGLLFRGYYRDLGFTKLLAFNLYALVALKLIISFATMVQMWPPDSLWMYRYRDLVLLGGLLYGLKRFLHRYAFSGTGSDMDSLQAEVLSLWAVCLFYVTTFYFLPDPALIISPLPMFALIYWGNRKALPFTHLLGYACYALILIQIIQSMQMTHSGYFSDQTLLGKCAMVEAFLALWLLQHFYERWVGTPGEKALEFAIDARTLFYLLCPLVYLSPIQRHLPDMFPLALWGSVAICYGMMGYLKLNALRYEFYILVAIAAFWSSLTYISGPNHDILSPEGMALLVGNVFLVFLLFHRKGHTEHGSRNPEYRPLFRLTYYYCGWCLFLLSTFLIYGGRLGTVVAFPLTGLYFLVLASLRSRAPALNSDIPLIFRLSQALSFLSLMVLGMRTAHVEDIPMGVCLPVFILIAIICCLFYRFIITSHDFYTVPTVTESGKLQHSISWVFDLHLTHLMFLLTYGIGLHYLTGEWLGPHLTVILVFHAIFLLFQTLKPRYLLLNRSSVLLFILAGGKLFFHDLADFSLIRKVLVFIVIGAAMLISAYFFQRIKIRLSDAAVQ